MTATVTTTGLIDETVALDLLDKAVARYGKGHVYDMTSPGESCRYVVDGEPACIVGVGLAEFGVPLDVFDDVMLNEASASGLPVYIAALTEPAAAVFEAAQALQDEGSTWGEAAAAAHRYVTTRTGGSL